MNSLVLLAFCAVVATSLGAECPNGREQISLQLKWLLQPQFAGYVVAYEKGFYADECIDIGMRTGGLGIDAHVEVSAGRAQFGVGWLSRLLTQREALGEPLVMVAQVFRRAAQLQVQFKSKGINGPLDLRGKTVCMWEGEENNLKALLAKYNMTWDSNWNAGNTTSPDVDIVQQAFSMGEFLNGNCDSAAAMRYNELALVLQARDPDGNLWTMDHLTSIDFNDEEVASLEDGLFVHADWLDENFDLAVRFLRASFRGWMFARDFPDEALRLFAQAGPLFHWHLNEVNKLVWPASSEGVGLVEPEMIQHTADITLRLGLLHNSTSVAEFFRPEAAREALRTLANAAGLQWASTDFGPGSRDPVAANYTPVELAFCDDEGAVIICDPERTMDPSNTVELTEAWGGVLIALVALSYLFTGAVLAGIAKYWNHKVIRTASRRFLVVMCLGSMIGVSSVWATFGLPTDETCRARNWLLGLGFVVFVGAFLLKVYRIHRIFGNSRLIVRLIPDSALFVRLAVALAVEVALLLLFTLAGDLRAETRLLKGRFLVEQVYCKVDNGSTWPLLLFVFKGVMLAYGVMLAVQTKDVVADFNESKFLGACLYNLTVVALIAVPLSNGVVSLTPRAETILRALAIVFVSNSNLAILFVPKFMVIRRGGPKSGGSSMHGWADTDRSSMGSLVNRVRDATDAELAERKDELATIRDLLRREELAIDSEIARRARLGPETELPLSLAPLPPPPPPEPSSSPSPDPSPPTGSPVRESQLSLQIEDRRHTEAD